ncbi:tRNA (adenosine(37)-N6)-dimethylallyltransferase MiaA [Nitratifractor sp.]
MQREPRVIALIGATASGKSSLALELASRHGAVILSLDSLAVYREIDIASAKPSKEERKDIPHYGIDLLSPEEPFDVTKFLNLFEEISQRSLQENRPIIIVGGSSFYLKILIEGISPLPPLSGEKRSTLDKLLDDLSRAHKHLSNIDPLYSAKISSNDRYRIEKGLQVYFSTGFPPSQYFALHPPRSPLQKSMPIFEIRRSRSELRQRISLRTKKMFDQGLIDEVAGLEYRYGRSPNAMKAIGIREVLDYFDGRINRKGLEEKIIINTARLAKRQETFNRSQFHNVIHGDIDTIRKNIESLWKTSSVTDFFNDEKKKSIL